MPSPARPRSGGPKSAAGRGTVAKNALVHGLTAERPADTTEAKLVEGLRTALLAQYKPQNTLVKLQIDRIARCAAKLQRLQNIEDAAFELAQQNALPTMEDIVAGMAPGAAEVQAEAVRILQGCSPSDALGLDDTALAHLCDEIKASGHGVRTMADVKAFLPKTYAFAKAASMRFDTGDVGLQLQALVESMRPAPAAAELPNRRVSEISDAELTTFINQQNAKSDGGVVVVRVRPQNDPDDIAQGLQDDLQALLNMQKQRHAVQEVVRGYSERCALLQRTALPPPEDADRLMRYHTALDRQLSKCMGELLQIAPSVR